MQPCATALFNVLENVTASDPRDLVFLFEFYDYTTTPGTDGFNPANAVQRFAKIEYTWLGFAYRRAVLSAQDITKAKGSQANRCTITLSNADENRHVATWITQNQIEGMRLVVRLISRSASTTLAASNQRFSGRCDKPEGFDVIQGSISATEDVGGDDVEFPPRLFLADDPEGRSPADPLNEGFPLVVLSGSFQHLRMEQDRSYSRKDMRRYYATLPYSSYDDTPLGEPLPMVLGRSQIRMNRGLYVDTGRVTNALDFIGMGPIAGVLNFRMNMDADYARFFAQPQDVTYHLGEAGGTGTQIADPIWPNHPLFSYTAYVTYHHVYIGTGAFTNIDAGQETIATILGLTMDTPDASGVFNTTDWSDDGAIQTRHLLTGDRFFNHDPAFVEDSACFATYRHNSEPLADDTNAHQIAIPDPDFPAAGVDFLRYRATGLINARRARHVLGLEADRAEVVDVTDFEPFDPSAPPTVFVDVRRLVKRFTSNVVLKKRVKAREFLYKTLLPSYRGFLVWNYRGKIEPRSERPSDFAHLRSASLAGATTVLVEDATPWKAAGGLWGQILLGSPLTTSEVRKVTAAAYTSDANAITLAASKVGAVTVSASGATLAGGDSATRATGTVTIGGTPAAGNTITVTIGGIAITYTVEADETAATVAYMVAMHVNANTQLRRFVSASASGSVVTVVSSSGVLTLSSALANAHAGPASNPTAAPSGLSASGSGSSLPAGDYRVAYANRNAVGSTYVSPYATVTVTAGQQINVPALAFPAGVTSRDWFVSKGAGDPEVVLHTNNTTALGFAVTAAPSSTAAFPPEYNTTGEEAVRIALPFASNNQTAAILAQANLTRGNIFEQTYKWPGGRDQASYTEVVGNYVSAKDDFAASKVIVRDTALQARLGKQSPRELDLTAVDNYNQARRLVLFDFAKFVDRHWFNSLRSNGPALLLEEGDLICASDDSGGHVNVLTQVEEFTIHLADFTVSVNKARLYSTQMFRERVPRTQPVLPSVLRWVTLLSTEIQLLDIPFWRESDAAKGPGLLVAVRRVAGTGDWRGSTVWLDTGDGYKQALDLDVEAVTGEALDVLADHAAGADATSTVRVRLDNTANVLTAATDEELRAGANLFRLAGEIFQAQTCALAGGTEADYDLTDLVRGLYGTEGETAGHSTGDEFTVLDGRVFHLPVDAGRAGSQIAVKALTVGQDLADAAAHLLDWEGNSLKPLAVARFETEEGTVLAPRDSAGSMLVQVWPRSNLANIGDEYFIEYLSDDRLTTMHSESFFEGRPVDALLVTNGGTKFTSVDRNTLSHLTTLPALNIYSKSLQSIRRGENFVEATLEIPGNGVAEIGLLAAAKDWRAATADFRVRAAYDGAGAYFLEAFETGNLTPLYSRDVSSERVAGVWRGRVRIALSGTRVLFFENYSGDGTPPLASSAVLPGYPLVARAYVGSLVAGETVKVESVVLKTDPLPSTTFTDEQQMLYYGTLKSPVQVRIRQHSGIREVGYGMSFEGEM